MRFVLAVAAVIVRDDRVLAMRRSSAKDAGAGLWETVSGRVEADEAPLDAIAREVREETGLVVAIDPRPIDAYTARRGEAPMAVVVYRAIHVSGEVVRVDLRSDSGTFAAAPGAKRTSTRRSSASQRRAVARTSAGSSSPKTSARRAR